jgi:hypothetical protein
MFSITELAILNYKHYFANLNISDFVIMLKLTRSPTARTRSKYYSNKNKTCHKAAFFVCCGGTGDPKNHEDSCNKYLSKASANYTNLKPMTSEAFGGRIKILGKTLFDNIYTSKIHAWGETLGKNLQSKERIQKIIYIEQIPSNIANITLKGRGHS